MSQIAKYIKTTPTRIQFQPAPAGTYIGTIVAVDEEFGVVRPKFETPTESETVDLTTIICSFKDAAGALHFVATASMRTSADAKSALVGFISGALGSAPWLDDENWDTQKLVGVRVQITVALQQAKKSRRVYSKITNVAPAMAQFADYAPSLAEAQIALSKYREAAAQQGPPRVVAPPGPLPNSAVWPPSVPLSHMPPSPGATIPTIQPPGATVSQMSTAPSSGWPVNPGSFAPAVFSGNPALPVSRGHFAQGVIPTGPIVPPTSQSPTTPPVVPANPTSIGQPGNAPFTPSAENPDLKF